MRKTAYLPAAACLLAIGYANAAPLRYSTLVVFGDSLNDAGQFPDAGGPPGAGLRFTNRTGPGYQDNNREPFAAVNSTLLGSKLGVSAEQLHPSTSVLGPQQGEPDGGNWATGGYTTRDILASITSTSAINGPGGLVLRQRPGYLPGRGYQADPNALYYINGGANDFFQGQVTTPAQAGAAAGRLSDSVRALQQAGARYLMVWLLPDLGMTPLNYGTPNQAALSQLSAAFNQALISQLATIQAQIIPLNVPLLFKEIIASPGDFGMLAGTPLLTTCFSGNNCTANPLYGRTGSNPDPSRLLFNDAVHPTAAGHTIIADYAYSLLSAPWELTLLPQMASSTLLTQEEGLHREWQTDSAAWQASGAWRAIVNVGGQRQRFDEQDSAVQADGNHANLQIGSSYRLADDWRFGVLAGAYRQRLKAGEYDSRYKLDSYLGSAFVQFQHDSWWADAALTGGYLNYRELQRTFALGVNQRAEQGSTDGALLGADARVGYDLAAASSAWQLSPFLTAAYSRVRVDGYQEQSERSTALTIDQQTTTSKRLGAGIQGSVRPLPGTRVFAELAHEHEFNSDPQTLTMNLNSVPELDYRLDGYRPAEHINRLSVGLDQAITPQLAVQASYTLNQADDRHLQGANLGLRLSF